MKAATRTPIRPATHGIFQSTPPVKAATTRVQSTYSVYRISIHAAREGGDHAVKKLRIYALGISIHAAREGGDQCVNNCVCTFAISIHAAREGGDVAASHTSILIGISIHAAREGGDLAVPNSITIRYYFNPRRP